VQNSHTMKWYPFHATKSQFYLFFKFFLSFFPIHSKFVSPFKLERVIPLVVSKNMTQRVYIRVLGLGYNEATLMLHHFPTQILAFTTQGNILHSLRRWSSSLGLILSQKVRYIKRCFRTPSFLDQDSSVNIPLLVARVRHPPS
jgi:hypothetical protein